MIEKPTPVEEIPKKKLLTRRRLFTVGAAVAFGLGYAAESAYEAFSEQRRDMNRASVDNKRFFKENRGLLQKIEFGCSFSPEEYHEISNDPDFSAREVKDESQEALRIIVEDLGIKNVRLGIRWNETVDYEGNFDFGFYKQYLDYCFQNNVSVCLNVGPIKTFRWPEDHVSKHVMSNPQNIPPEYSFIRPKTQLAQESEKYLDQLFEYFTTTYTPLELSNIQIIQPENEPFMSFGENKWLMHQSYIKSLTNKINQYFPKAAILLNSGGYSNLETIAETFEEIRSEIPDIKLVSGFDYYYLLPSQPSIPFLGQLDQVALSKILKGDICTQNKQRSKEIGYDIEITEGQAEPWGEHKSPGNKAKEFRFMVLRTAENILDTRKSGNSTLRIWGIEKLVKKMVHRSELTQEHEKIIELIMMINSGRISQKATV